MECIEVLTNWQLQLTRGSLCVRKCGLVVQLCVLELFQFQIGLCQSVEVVAASQFDDVLVWHFVGKSFQLIRMVLRLECLLEDLE